jgi:hypothetical protein
MGAGARYAAMAVGGEPAAGRSGGQEQRAFYFARIGLEDGGDKTNLERREGGAAEERLSRDGLSCACSRSTWMAVTRKATLQRHNLYRCDRMLPPAEPVVGGPNATQGHSRSLADHLLAEMFRSLCDPISCGADGCSARTAVVVSFSRLGRPFRNSMLAAETALDGFHNFLH